MACAYGIFVRGSNVLGIDFAGGDSVTMSFKEKVDVDKLRAALAKVGDTQIQYQKGAEQDMLEVVAPFGKGGAVTNALLTTFPAAGFHVVGSAAWEPRSGLRFTKSAIIASFLSLFGILLYVAFRYEFSFSVRSGAGGDPRCVDDHGHLFPFRPAIERADRGGGFDHHWFLHQRQDRDF